MATSGTYATNHIKAGSRTWYWEFYFSTSYSGNTATVSWNIHTRCETGTSGQSYVGNYGFSGSVNGTSVSKSGNFVKDEQIASGSFTKTGGQSFTVSISANPYSSSYTSSGSWTITLDNKVTTPTVTCSITARDVKTISASMTVTNNGGASIVDNYIDLFSDSNLTNKVATITGTSGTFSNLNIGTTYYARANASNGTYRGYSSKVTTSTKATASITNAPNYTHGDTYTVTYSNPDSLAMQIGIFYNGNLNTALAGYRNCTGSSYTFTFTDTELDNFYKKYGNASTLTFTVGLKSASVYVNTINKTATLTGNQKTIRKKVSGSWKRGKVYVKVSGTWRKGVVWRKVSGTWKRGI